MTNREVHEEAAGMNLCEEFFSHNGINPEGEASNIDVLNVLHQKHYEPHAIDRTGKTRA